jgi:threonine dehydratase
VDDLVLVDEGDIEQAVLMLLEIEKTVVEGAGAAGLAALLKYPERFRGRKVGLVLCGGNIDPCCWRPSSSAAWCAPGGWRG